MSQNYFISMGPTGFVSEQIWQIGVLRGHAQFVIRVEIARIVGTSFGKELLQRLNSWKGRPWGRAREEPVFDLILQHCLPLLERLALTISLQDLSLEAFLHSPTHNLDIIDGGIDDVQIEGEDKCLHTPIFFTSPTPIADLPETCNAIPFFQAQELSIAPILEGGKTVDSIQGRVMALEGVALYFKPRQELREQEFDGSSVFFHRSSGLG